ncbi:hypothetical protein [Dietzia alimentaria]|uniref:hypothetical protein n=1 Tax=Dietzia alimentaria TaxID=665550 RepID=UPI0009DA823D|nr:hypothetical protein [Dietzia alimentaria]
MTQHWQGYEYQPEPQRKGSAPVIVAVAVLGVLVLALLAAIAYLALRPDKTYASQQGQAVAASSSSPSAPSSRPPVTEYTTPPEQETVTVTREAPRTRPQGSTAIPSGADSSGWVSNSQARCNAGDPAAMIGKTTQASFSICVNPDNGRYYYRGSSGGSGVEIDDPEVFGRSATATNNGVMYVIDPSEMLIYEGGELLSSQPMVQFWAG